MPKNIENLINEVLARGTIRRKDLDDGLLEFEDPFDRIRYLTEMSSFVDLRLEGTKVVRVEEGVSERLRCLQKEAIEQAKKMTSTDRLTGTYNRNHIDGVARELKDRYAVLMVDIDNFKRINDIYGHTVGDIVIKNVARIILRNLRESYVGRYGGEEFYVELNRTDKEGGRAAAERVRKAIEGEAIGYLIDDLRRAGIPVTERIKSERITVSIGVADEKQGEFPYDARVRADNALYLAKKFGRNKVLGDGDDPLKSLNWRQKAMFYAAEELGTFEQLIRAASGRMKSYLR